MTDRPTSGLTRRVILGLLAAGAGLSARAAEDGPVGVVERLSGQAYVRRGALEPLKLKADILLADDVSTAVRSRATLAMKGGNRLYLGPATQVVIDRYIAEAGGDITLESGALVFDRPEDEPKTDIAVRTVFGLIGVRGTQFFAGPSRGVFGVFVARGEVQFQAAGTVRRIRAGEGVDVREPGSRPGPVRRWSQDRVNEAYALVGG